MEYSMLRSILTTIILLTVTTGSLAGPILGRDVTLPTEYPLRAIETSLEYSPIFDIEQCIPELGTEKGLFVNLPADLSGRVYYGVRELTADPPRVRLRKSVALQEGAAELNLKAFTRYPYDISRFNERQESDFFLQFEIWDAASSSTLLVHRIIHVRLVDGIFHRALTLVEGPIYSCEVDAGVPVPVISLVADRPAEAQVLITGHNPFVSHEDNSRHEIKLTGLLPATVYEYQVEISSDDETTRSPLYTLTTPPLPGDADTLRAILMSDCRAGVGAGEQAVEGVNFTVLGQLAAQALLLEPDLMLFPGDLINGWTNDPGTYLRELRSFKRTLGWLLPTVPFFAGMGNHETLLHFYDDGGRWGIGLDRTPYATHSAEALFAAEFANPTAAPQPESEQAPPYTETVYALPWGKVLFLMLNSNYWFSTDPENFGGNVEGGMLDNQLDWMQKQITSADADPDISWIVYATHEPTFPNGGHPQDAMWYNGGTPENNYGRDRSEVIERRDRWWSMIASSSKSLLVFNGDEHNYSRTLVDSDTPVYLDGSSNHDFKYPVWQIVSGGAGAPYYTQAQVPWSDAVLRFDTRQHFVLLQFEPEKVMLQARGIDGVLVDEVELSRIR
jgi:hypothetical protein